ncbi:TetR family transcriptional regulator [Luteibacter sp. OK325]|uniref:TetR/AcrR family transcriptional regulator n=1 Tax=Luteibacter sp. OK325 TaxID=2135670 RepID=UPI000D3677C2|nr:TetR/AcrR family transcriptional regulator [Luteibacter sp. OK325]PTR25502.1 TetR family transcriptional regulator [Luteibacter sp. OK325]
MPRTGLPADQLKKKAIDATLARMRLVGFDKVRLSDVARDIGVSHAALYAHFTDKAALLDAVTAQWLQASHAAAIPVTEGNGTPDGQILEWFVTLYRMKRARAIDDPELYRAFDIASALDKPFVIAHLKSRMDQLSSLVMTAGLADGPDALQTANLLYRATAAFHHPTLIAQTAQDDLEPELRRIVELLLRGIHEHSSSRDQDSCGDPNSRTANL